jgi:hypothetical protein
VEYTVSAKKLYVVEEKIGCDQCAPAMINGVFCHEKGCPNSRKTWVTGRGWVRMVACRECDSIVEADEVCACRSNDGD